MSYHHGRPFCANTIAGIRSEQRRHAGGKGAERIGLQGRQHEVLRAEIGRMVGGGDARVEFLAPARSVRPFARIAAR